MFKNNIMTQLEIDIQVIERTIKALNDTIAQLRNMRHKTEWFGAM